MNYPYVYKGTNPESGEFYFGYREANKLPAELDLGVVYFTSSETVKPIFHNFTWEILAEYIFSYEDMSAGTAAYWDEQRLIKYHFNDPLCLNRHYVDPDSGFEKFNTKGEMSDELKQFHSERMKDNNHRTGTKQSQSTKDKISKSLIGNKRAGKWSEERKAAWSERTKGKPKTYKQSAEWNENMGKTKRKPLYCEGFIFPSLRKAAIVLGISEPTILKRIKSPDWDYFYFPTDA